MKCPPGQRTEFQHVSNHVLRVTHLRPYNVRADKAEPHTNPVCAFYSKLGPTSAPLRIVPKPFSVTYKPTLVLTSSSNGTTSVYTPFKPLSPLFTLPTVLRLSLSLLSLPNSTVTFLALSQSRFCKKKIRGRFGSLNQAFVS